MNALNRIVVAAVASGSLMLGSLEAPAQQPYPSKPIRVIIPTVAGGSADNMIRAVGQAFAERNGQPFLIESRPGANSIIAAETCAKAAADGYTFCLLTRSTISLNPSLYAKKLPYDPGTSFEPITGLVIGQEVLVLHPSIPANTTGELVAYSKQHPEKINYASSGIGSNAHLMMERFKRHIGGQFTHIPYKGASQGPQAFAAGDVQLMYLGVGNPGVLAQIRAGKSNALLVSGDRRIPSLPNVPTFVEAGYRGFDAPNWFGTFAPAGTPKNIVAKLASEMTAIVRSPAFGDKFLAPSGYHGFGGTPEEFARFLAEDRKSGAALVKFSGARLD
jgi:tripartite-type tricarboxylate transporter receptor subunit TctC